MQVQTLVLFFALSIATVSSAVPSTTVKNEPSNNGIVQTSYLSSESSSTTSLLESNQNRVSDGVLPSSSSFLRMRLNSDPDDSAADDDNASMENETPFVSKSDDEFVSNIETFLAFQNSLFVPWLHTSSSSHPMNRPTQRSTILFSMDDDTTKILLSFSTHGTRTSNRMTTASVPSDTSTSSFHSPSSLSTSSSVNSASTSDLYDRIHALCASDVQYLCSSSSPLVMMDDPSKDKDSIPSLGYSCHRINTCLWNAFQQMRVASYCYKAILDLTSSMTTSSKSMKWITPTASTITSTAPTTVTGGKVPTDSSSSYYSAFFDRLEHILLWLQAHTVIQTTLALILSLIMLSLAFSRHFHHRRHHHQHQKKRQILQAIQQDAQLRQHVERVLGESISFLDIHFSKGHPCPTVPSHPMSSSSSSSSSSHNLLYHVATCIIPKTTLIALVLFLAWTSPLFMIVFLTFHLGIVCILCLLVKVCRWIRTCINNQQHTPSSLTNMDSEHDNGIHPLFLSTDASTTTAFVGVPLKIV